MYYTAKLLRTPLRLMTVLVLVYQKVTLSSTPRSSTLFRWYFKYEVVQLLKNYDIHSSCLLIRFMPESFRWLVSHRRFDCARHVIERIAKINGVAVPDLSELEKVALNDEATDSRTYTILDLVKTREVRKNTLLLSVIWWVKINSKIELNKKT